MLDAILEAWRSHEAINRYMLAEIPDKGLAAIPLLKSGEPGKGRDVARQIDRIRAGLQGVAEDDMIDAAGGYSGAFERPLCGDDAEIGGGKVLEGTAKASEAGADAGEQENFLGVPLGGHRLLPI